MSKVNILFVTKNVPYPTHAGSSQRTAILIEALGKIGDVDLFLIGPHERKLFLQEHGFNVVNHAEATCSSSNFFYKIIAWITPKFSGAILRVIKGVSFDYTPDKSLISALDSTLGSKKYDLVVGRYLIPSAQSGMLEHKMVPSIVDIDDVDTLSLAAKIKSPATSILMRLVLKLRMPKVKFYENKLWHSIDKLWFSNPGNITLTNGIDVDVIPNIPFQIPAESEISHSSQDSKIILWVGSFNHRVNLEGVDHFLEHAWLRILEACPNAIFKIVGSHLEEKTRKKWQAYPNVDVVGFAESLPPLYAEAAFSIVPLLDGAGTKIKVLESLAFKRTCLVTTHAVNGFETLLVDGESVRIGNDLDELIALVPELLNNHLSRWTLENRGREIIQSHFSRDAVFAKVSASVNSLIGTRVND